MIMDLNLVTLRPYLNAGIIFISGLILITLCRYYLNRFIVARFSQPSLLPLSHFLYWLLLLLFAIMSLKQLGFELGLVLQAAGFLTVALGFGLQGIASNFVCGLFLLTDKSFKLGDTVRVGDQVGEIHLINLLATHLIDENHQIVRMPNDFFFKSTLVNLSYDHKRYQKFNLVLFDCPLQNHEITALLNQQLPADFDELSCTIQQIDSRAHSLTLVCSYSCGLHDDNNVLLNHVAAQLNQAKLAFQIKQ